MCLQYKYCENIVGKGENSSFPTAISTHLESFLPFSLHLILSSSNSLNLKESKLCGKGIILHQTKFGLVQIRHMCRRYKKCNSNDDFCLWFGSKHCKKRRKCWLTEFPPTPTILSRGFVLRFVKLGFVCESSTLEDLIFAGI